MAQLPMVLKRVVARLLEHDCLNLAQSAAYTAMVALFPALVVAAALIAQMPDVTPLKVEVGAFFDEVMPANVFPVLTSYFVNANVDANGKPHTAGALIAAAIVSLIGASSSIATLMEGLHRAADVPFRHWSFWRKRTRSLLLVPLSLVPLGIASILVVAGRVHGESGKACVFCGGDCSAVDCGVGRGGGTDGADLSLGRASDGAAGAAA